MKKIRTAVLFFLLIIMAVVFTGCGARLNRAVPSSGSVGSTITLKGSRFGDSPGEARVMFGETEGSVVLWSNRQIKVKVPAGAESGDIHIVRDEEITKSVKFRLLEEEYEVLVEKDVFPTDSVQVIEAEGLAVTLPPGVIGSNAKLVISKVANAPGFPDDIFSETDVYSVRIGNTETFNDFLVLEFDIDEKIEDSQYIRAAYWDEDRQEWTEAPTHVDPDNGVARVYTSHLTNWRLLALKQAYSVYETGRFIIAYDRKDNAEVPGQDAIKKAGDMAVEIGSALDNAYTEYLNALGKDKSPLYLLTEFKYVAATLNPSSWFKESTETVDTRLIVKLSSSYNKYGAEYGWATGQIKLPAKYKDADDMQATAAHELFHAFQNHGLNVLNMSDYRWMMEATAEYASYYVGTGIGIKDIHTYARIDKNLEFFENRGGGHEYAMSSYIRYLADNGADLGAMWNAVTAGRPSLGEAFDNYVASATGMSNKTAYRLFWQDVLTNSERPGFGIIDIGIKGRSFGLKKVVEAKLSIVRDWSMAAFWTQPRTYNSDGSKTLLVEVVGDMPEGVWVDVFKVDGFDKKAVSYNRIAGGKTPEGTLGGNAKYIPVHFAEDMNEIMFVTAYGSGKGAEVNIRVSDISLKLKPDKMDVVEPFKLYKFDATAENIPDSITDLKITWELDDGTLLRSEELANKNGRVRDKLAYEFEDDNIRNIVVKVSDADTGVVITKGIIKISETEVLSISYDPRNPKIDEEIEFSSKGSPNLYYKWEAGDGTASTGNGKLEFRHSYKAAGRFQVRVTGYEDSAMTVSKAFGTVVVEVSEMEEDPVESEEPQETGGGTGRWLAFDKDIYLPGDLMHVEIESGQPNATSYESVNYYKWSAEPADDATKAALVQATGKDYLYKDKSGEPGTVAPGVPGTYVVTGIFVQDPNVTISGTFVVKDGQGGYWKRVDYTFPKAESFDTTTVDSSDSRITTRSVASITKTSYDLTVTTSFPDKAAVTTTHSMTWADLPETLTPGQQLTFTYTSRKVSSQDGESTSTESGLGVYYNGWGNAAGIKSDASSAGWDTGLLTTTVVFEVPAYGSVGNATETLELFSGLGNRTEDRRMLVAARNSLYIIYASYVYVE